MATILLEFILKFLLYAMALVAAATGEWVIAQWAVLFLILVELGIWHSEWRKK